MGLRSVTPSSSKSMTVHVILEEAEAMALYSASEEDLETVGCFLDFQKIRDFPSRKMYPLMDLLLSGQEAQSKSEKACYMS